LLKDSQAPKGIVLPGALLNRVVPVVAQRVPVQLLRIGPLYLIGIPGEVTITAGLRLRRTVAGIVGADLQDVLVAGYSNGYIHYVTTPEEYDAQQYEGGSTLFGRWELPALQQTAAALALAMQRGSILPEGNATADLSHRFTRHRDRSGPDAAPPGTSFGDVVVAPRSAYAARQRVTVTFTGAHPDNQLHRGGTYLEVQWLVGDAWVTVRDDGDWDTRFVWRQGLKGESEATVSWDIPEDAPPGQYRIRYLGEAKDDRGVLHAFDGASPVFAVTVPVQGGDLVWGR
jgi:neutral ceramidase